MNAQPLSGHALSKYGHDDELNVDTDDDSTINTPDELGGTGGQQPGGAG